MRPRGAGRPRVHQPITISVPRSAAQVIDRERWGKGRAEIAAAALPLFLRYGYHATPVRTIGDAVGISVGSIFNYFSGKDEILQCILNDGQARAERAVEEAQAAFARADSRRDSVEVFLEVYRRYARSIDDVRQFTLLAYQEAKSLTPEQRAPLLDRERRIAELLKKAAEPAIRARIFSREALDAKAHSLVVLAHAWAVRRWALAQYPDFAAYLADLEQIAVGVMKAGGFAARAPARRGSHGKSAAARMESRGKVRSLEEGTVDGREAADSHVFRPYRQYRKRREG